MFFDDLDMEPPIRDGNEEAAEEAYFNSPEGMKQQIASLQQYNSLLVAQHERMEELLREYKQQLPMVFVQRAKEAGYELPIF